MGGLSFFVFLALTVTGVLLMFYYRPTAEYAYNDIIALREHASRDHERNSSLGSSLDGYHRLASHVPCIHDWFHKPPREFNWGVGVILLVLTMLLSFTGYLLPWDQLAIWAITVGSNMAKATPFLGHGGPGAMLAQIGDFVLVSDKNDVRYQLLGGRFVESLLFSVLYPSLCLHSISCRRFNCCALLEN